MAAAPDSSAFTSWKLDMIDALLISVSPREFRVACCLLQHANAVTRLIFPSQARIALLLGVDHKTIERAIAGLVDKGWLEKTRTNRQKPNSYRFSDRRAELAKDLRTGLEDRWRANRDAPKVTGRKNRYPPKLSDPDPSKLGVLEPPELGAKHPKGTPEGEHLNRVGATKGEVLSTELARDACEPSKSERAASRAGSELGESHPSGDLERTHMVRDLVRPAAATLRVVVDPKTSLDALEQRSAGGRR